MHSSLFLTLYSLRSIVTYPHLLHGLPSGVSKVSPPKLYNDFYALQTHCICVLRNVGYSLRSVYIYIYICHIKEYNSCNCTTHFASYFALINTARRVRKIAKAIISFVTAVRLSARNNSAPTGRIFTKFGISGVFDNMSRLFNFYYTQT